MSEKPEALRLVNVFAVEKELRRLHAENERLRELLTEAKDLAWAFGADSLRDRINAALRREET